MTVWSLTHIRHDGLSCILGVYSTAKRARDACDALYTSESLEESRWSDAISRDRVWERTTSGGSQFSVKLHVLDEALS